METKIKSDSKVVGIRGASGFLGKAISEALIENGFRVIGLRRDFTVVELKDCDVVINLAGRNINCRWNAKNRVDIRLACRLDDRSGIGIERFEIATLALVEQNVECER